MGECIELFSGLASRLWRGGGDDFSPEIITQAGLPLSERSNKRTNLILPSCPKSLISLISGRSLVILS